VVQIVLEIQCASRSGSEWLYYHTLRTAYIHTEHNTAYFFLWECICAFAYMLLHSLKLLHSNSRHLCAWKRSFRKHSTSMKSERCMGALSKQCSGGIKYKAWMKQRDVNAKHVIKPAKNSCSHWSDPSEDTSLLQQLQQVTQRCAISKDRPTVWERSFHYTRAGILPPSHDVT